MMVAMDILSIASQKGGASKDTIALTVRLDRECYLRLKNHGVSLRPRKTSQHVLVEALKSYLA